jgi:hypothetical protein
VAGGAGKISGYLYQNSILRRLRTIQKGGNVESATMKYNSSPHYATYDFGVYGLKNGSKYRISGRWFYSYNAAAPEGGGASCTP